MTMKGFTLIELMVTVVVLAVLLTIGVPSFNATIRDSRLTAQSNDLLGAMMAARSEAAKRNEPVRVAASTRGWSAGWQIRNLDNDVLRAYSALSGGNVLECDGNCDEITFLGSGSADTGTNFILCDKGGQHARVIQVLNSGKARVRSVDAAGDLEC